MSAPPGEGSNHELSRATCDFALQQEPANIHQAARCGDLRYNVIGAQAQTFTVLHNFTGGLDGANPYTGLTMDRSGNFYGTTAYGGSQSDDCHVVGGCGTVFKLARQGQA